MLKKAALEPVNLDKAFLPLPAGAESDSPASLVLPSPIPSGPVNVAPSHLCILTALYVGFILITLRMAFASMPANITLTLFAVGCLTWLAIACFLPRYVVGLHARIHLHQAFPLILLTGILSSVVPVCIVQVLLAGLLQSYIVHEWIVFLVLLS